MKAQTNSVINFDNLHQITRNVVKNIHILYLQREHTFFNWFQTHWNPFIVPFPLLFTLFCIYWHFSCDISCYLIDFVLIVNLILSSTNTFEPYFRKIITLNYQVCASLIFSKICFYFILIKLFCISLRISFHFFFTVLSLDLHSPTPLFNWTHKQEI